MSDGTSGEQAARPGGAGAPVDPGEERLVADAAVQRAADQLRPQLERLARAIDPFPPFPGAMFAYGIEVSPPGGPRGDSEGPGCVVLGNDGGLYELQIGIDPAQLAIGGDHVAARHEELVPLDLPPAAYIAYAHEAVLAACAVLESDAAGPGSPGQPPAQ